jgi:hypothetical protein
METEIAVVETGLKKLFQSASDIFIDPHLKECEVKVSVDEFQGEITGRIFENGVQYNMVDYCDIYPFKYVFSYKKKKK